MVTGGSYYNVGDVFLKRVSTDSQLYTIMAYSDLLARQDKELEGLHQAYYADQVTLQKIQDQHYDKTRFAGQLERLKEAHERNIKETQVRFAVEQKSYLNEPASPTPETEQARTQPDISDSQDKMAATLEQRRQQREEREAQPQQDPRTSQEPIIAGKDKDMTDEVQRLMKQAQERRAQQKQQHQRGFRR